MDAVLNWVWQGCVVAIVTAATLAALAGVPARVRYWIVCAALLSILLLPLVPSLYELASPAPRVDPVTDVSSPVFAIPATWWTSNAIVAMLWAVWSAVCAARIAVAALALRRARQASRPAGDLEARLPGWSRLMHSGRRATLVLSDGIQSAAVLGCGSPVIALAPAVVDRLTDADLDRVLAHEWAHVQRRDDITNRLQLFVRVLAGWHPAVWWCEGQLRVEREVASDQIAVALTGSAKDYAACLTTLAALRMPLRATAAAVSMASSGLRHRILRILSDAGDAPRPWRARAAGGAALPCAIALIIGGLQPIELTANVGAVDPVSEVEPERRGEEIPTVPTQPISTLPAAVPEKAGTVIGARSVERKPIARATSSSQAARPVRVMQANDRAISGDVIHGAPVDPPAAVPVQLVSSRTIVPLSTGGAPELRIDAGAPPQGTPPWTAAADAGVAIGRGSRNAGVATAGFFTRFGKRVASSF